ncbi:aminopeptidase N, partial [Biomphalaria pfeifferi]
QLCPESTTATALTSMTSGPTVDIAEVTTLSTDSSSSAPTAPSTSTPLLNVRLLTSVTPLHYNLEIQTYMNSTDPKDFKFK